MKKNRLNFGKVLVIILSLYNANIYANGHISINNLTVDFCETPIGIDNEKPHFSWQMQSPENIRGNYQTAYQIQVFDPSGLLVWNTNKRSDCKSVAIRYNGLPLKPRTLYNWTIKVWDQENNIHSATSWFETGLMDETLKGFNGGKWIGGSNDDLVFFSDYQMIFRMKYSIQIAPKSSKASLIYGANDIRLLDKNKNIYQIENRHNQSYIKIELDISSIDGSPEGLAKINVFRVGYSKGDNSRVPISSFLVNSDIINQNNKHDFHNIEFKSVFGKITLSLNGKKKFFVKRIETKKKTNGISTDISEAEVNLNPAGPNWDYIPFGMVCDIGFSLDAFQEASFHDVVIFNDRHPQNIIFKEDLSHNYDGIFKNLVKTKNEAYFLTGGSNGLLITANPSRNSMPMLRTEFSAQKSISKARLYVTSRGIYEFFINGDKVGNDYYNPGLTQYNKTHFYQTYDVTELLVDGKNAMGAMLGEGWWSGLLSFGTIWNHFGDRQSLLAQLIITYDDGTESIIITNNEDWKYYNQGPIIYSSLNSGEIYNATLDKKIEGWSKPNYKDKNWKLAEVVPLIGTTYKGEQRESQGISKFHFDDMKLIGQIGNNAKQFSILTAKNMKEVRRGVYVYDMGQNFVGVPRITIHDGHAGDTLILRYSEMLYPDLIESSENAGMIMTENYRAALCQDIYIMKDGFQTFQPKFTSRGYQYIEITGIESPLPLKAVQGVAISSIVKLTADYNTSNSKVNKLWSNLVWSNIDNFLTIPTDCPQRNERMGWSGDISVFSRTATYISNTAQFLKRHLMAMRDTQNENGRFADIAPIGGGFGGILWGSAGITVPWELFQQYNDTIVLKEHYKSMKAYIYYLDNSIDPITGIIRDGQLGDWLGPQNNQLGTPFLTTAYHVYNLGIMQNVAMVLGKKDDSLKFAEMYQDRKRFFNETFINNDNKTVALISSNQNSASTSRMNLEPKLADTQTSYAVGLALGVFEDQYKPIMAKNLAESVSRKNKDDAGIVRPEFSLMTGFIGTAWINKALSDYGHDAYSYKLLQNNKYPSWLYSIDQGATTIWERLNGYTIENGFGGNNSMNSFNHYSFGAVGQWMIAYSLGIMRDKPGFKSFILKPTPDPTGEMKWAEGYYDSMYGRIKSKWQVDNEKMIYETTIPANTTATLYLPINNNKNIIENGQSIENSNGITFLRFEDDKAIFHLESGNYKFQVN